MVELLEATEETTPSSYIYLFFGVSNCETYATFRQSNISSFLTLYMQLEGKLNIKEKIIHRTKTNIMKS